MTLRRREACDLDEECDLEEEATIMKSFLS